MAFNLPALAVQLAQLHDAVPAAVDDDPTEANDGTSAWRAPRASRAQRFLFKFGYLVLDKMAGHGGPRVATAVHAGRLEHLGGWLELR